MLAEIRNQKSFLVKISMLFLILALSKGLREQAKVEDRSKELTKTMEYQNPLVLTSANSVTIFPSATLSAEIN